MVLQVLLGVRKWLHLGAVVGLSVGMAVGVLHLHPVAGQILGE